MKDLQLYDETSLPERALCYVMDPMCSWCWAFARPFGALLESNQLQLPTRYVMGGLAPDSEAPMPAPMQAQIAEIWRQIEARTGTPFNHDFWRLNQPRRATYPACRAVIAAAQQDPALLLPMIAAIQQGYYLEARNPAESAVLVEFAVQLGLERQRFAAALDSAEVNATLQRHLRFRDRLLVQGYPALVLWQQGEAIPLSYGYCDLASLQQALRRHGLV